MDDSTKTGLEVGGIALLIGVIASLFSYGKGHVDGHKDGLAEGVGLGEDKYRRMKDEVERQNRRVQSLEDETALMRDNWHRLISDQCGKAV